MLVLGLRVATWLLGYVPRRAARCVATVLGDCCWATMPQRRRTIARNLSKLAPNQSVGERRSLCRATFRRLARAYVDFLRLLHLPPGALQALVTCQGFDRLETALARGRGVIIVSAHCGAWELSGPLVAAHGYDIHGYVEDAAIDPRVFRAFQRYRESTGLTLIPLSHGARAGLRVLRAGGILGVLGDRVIQGTGVAVPFGSGARLLPSGPAALARWSGATILIGHIVEQDGAARPYLATLEELEIAPGDDDAAVTRRIGQRLSDVVTRYPDQWFVFQPDWLEERSS